jgi:DNA polymerase-3 subunit gamma/tau
MLARAAQGSMRDALSLLDQAIAHGGGSVAQDSVRAMLGVVGRDHLFAILRALAARDGAALVAEAARMAEHSLSFDQALQDIATLVHRLSLAQAVPETIGDDDPDRATLNELAGLFAAEDLQLYYQIAIQGRSDLGLAPDEHAGFTMTLLRMLAFAPAEAGAAAQASGAPCPAVAAAPAASPKKNRDDGDWQQVVERLGLTGMARVLAQHCELVARDAARVELRIAQTHQHLLEGPFQERLKGALQQYFGSPLRLAIQVAADAGGSPAAIADRDRRERQEQAIAGIERDPFVRELVESFDARVNESSIKPASSKNGKP